MPMMTRQERIMVQVPEICHERKTTHVSATWLFHSIFIEQAGMSMPGIVCPEWSPWSMLS